MNIPHYDKYGNKFIRFDIIPNLPNVVKKASSPITRKKLRFLMSRKHVCAICGVKAYYIGFYKHRQTGLETVDLYTKDGVMFNVDHIIPVSKGGANTDSNKQCTCHDCNNKKGDKLPDGTIIKVIGGKFIPYNP